MISGIGASSNFGFDRVYLSGERRQAGAAAQTYARPEKAEGAEKTESGSAKKSGELTAEQQTQISKLAVTDRKVRAHEMAHVAAGGELVQGAASFDYQTGPDGKRYAVGGEVSIDTSKGRTAEETISKAEKIRAAALAPADPSPQDNRVAALATQMQMQAYQELSVQRSQESASSAETFAPSFSTASENRNAQALSRYAANTGTEVASKQASSFQAYA